MIRYLRFIERGAVNTSQVIQIIWLVFTVFALIFAFMGIPHYLKLLHTACLSRPCFQAQLQANIASAWVEHGSDLETYAQLQLVIQLTLSGLLIAMSAVLIWRKPLQRLPALAAFVGTALATSTFCQALAYAQPQFTLIATLIVTVHRAGLLPLFLLFPDGQFRPRWLRWVALLYGFISVFYAFEFNYPDLTLTNNNGSIGLILGLIFLSIGMLTLFSRYRQAATSAAQEQMMWILAGIILAGTAVFLSNPQWLLTILPIPIETLLFDPLVVGFMILLLIIGSGTCLLVALVNYEQVDARFFINRTLVYSLLTLFVIISYVLAVGSLSLLFQSSGNRWFSLVATGLVAVLFQPVREQIQRFVNQLLYGTQNEPYQLLTTLGRQLEAAFESESILLTITQLVKESLRLPYIAIALEQNGVSKIAAATGTPNGQPISFPLTHQGNVIGHMLVNLRDDETKLSPKDHNLLTDLAQQASVAVYSVRLTADLQRSREHLVLAREEERRRLRRDLHDDLAPTLIGLSLRASSISDLIKTDPTKAALLADNLDAAIRNTVKNIRRLVYDLRPPALDDLGLLVAIRERAFEYSNGHGLRVEVDMPEKLPPLPAAVEVAAYRIIQEALLNVLKHAQAQTCSIRITLAKELHIEIFDNGIGLPKVHTMGVGLHSIQERVAELGGTCQFMTDFEKGTRIIVGLPVQRRESI